MSEKNAKPKVQVRLYRFNNSLKSKLGGLSATTPGDGAQGVEIDQAALAKAGELFEEMAEDYPDWVSGLINELGEHHRRCVDSPDKRRPAFSEIARIAHDMKGQGGTFGYPLITEFADSLYDFSSLKTGFTDNHVEIVKAHIDAMRAVIRERVKGDGGETGAALAQGLKSTIDKYKVR